MSDLPTREAVTVSLAIVDEASTMGVDPIVRYPTLRRILDAYAVGRLVDRDTIELDWETNPDGSLQWVALLSDGVTVTTLGIVPL